MIMCPHRIIFRTIVNKCRCPASLAAGLLNIDRRGKRERSP
jgi:hypothetical protein